MRSSVARMIPGRCAVGVFALALAGSAVAAGRDSNAPVDFGADHVQLLDQQNRAILTGHVNVKQGAMTLDADRMTVSYTGKIVGGAPQVSRLDAAGGVVVTRPNQTAHSRYAVYDLDRHVVTMLDGVTLTQGANTVSGGRLTINLDSGQAVIDGSAVDGGAASAPGSVSTGTGGRVTGRFSVPQHGQ